jgi:hypothetical protein
VSAAGEGVDGRWLGCRVTGDTMLGCLLAAMFAAASGAEVHVVGRDPGSLALARDLGADGAWTPEDLPERPYHAVIDPEAALAALRDRQPLGRLVAAGEVAAAIAYLAVRRPGRRPARPWPSTAAWPACGSPARRGCPVCRQTVLACSLGYSGSTPAMPEVNRGR